MAKNVQKLRLSEDDKFDFTLIGIISQVRDYRICKELNRKLEIKLSKQDEYEVFNNKRMEDQFFSFYEYVTADGDRFNLISNKSQKGFLLPEQNQIDYLFIIRTERMRIDEEILMKTLKETPLVLGAYKLDTSKLKSKENLVF
jgi:hypothetical protein